MAWSTPKTWVDTNDRLNAANLNQYIRDNQLALRAESAALSQRVAAQEASGFSDEITRSISFTQGNAAVLTDLQPPAQTKLIYFSVLVNGPSAVNVWAPGPLLDYALWNDLPVSNAGAIMTPASGYPFGVRTERGVADGYVGKGIGNVLAFAVFTSANSLTRISVRWYR
jgi:hypothetical protein